MKIPFTSVHVYLGNPDKKLDQVQAATSPSNLAAAAPTARQKRLIPGLYVGSKSALRAFQIAELDDWTRERGSEGEQRSESLDRIMKLLNTGGPESSLSLAGFHLTSLPKIMPLRLVALHAPHNRIAAVRPEIYKLTKLESMDLSDNEIQTLTAEIGQLTNLRTLDLANNQITYLPAELGQLTNLTTLKLDNNQIAALPEEMGKLSLLNDLSLRHNGLATVPDEMTKLYNLRRLDLSHNAFTHVPRCLLNMPYSTQIDLRNNPLPREEIEAVVRELDQMREERMIFPEILW